MKKITLSAAIVALAMMGCSDAGLDNSVASTSEVNNEQTKVLTNEPLVLAKLQPNPLENGTQGLKEYFYKINGKQTHIIVHATTDYIYGQNRGAGIFALDYGEIPDVVNVYTVAGIGCHFDYDQNHQPIDAHCDHVRAHFEEGYKNNVMYPSNDVKSFTADLDAPQSEIFVVAAYSAIWNNGKPNQEVFTTATYGGAFWSSSMAFYIYNNYLMKAYQNRVEGRNEEYGLND